MTITLEVQELESAIKAERVAYYSGRPLLVPDREYDLQVLRLSELAPDSPVLHTVGQAVEDFRSAVTLPVLMLSITNVFTEEDLRKWVNLLPPNTLLLVQPKVDGVAGCIFDESNTVVAATRGDGVTGENVTLTALHIVEKATGIPSPVIGEFYTPTAVHSENVDLFSSPRSMTVGSLKNSAKGNSGLTGLSFIQHDGEEISAFEQIPTKTVSSSDAFSVVWAVVTSVYNTPYPYAIDGVVIKVANKQIREKLGVTSSAPKWARAFKRNLESCDTTLTGITWQVGRTGVVTPVAHFQPVVLGGHEIKCATLHNISYVTRYAVGDIVSVGRAGGVIPEVIDCVSAEGGNPLEVPVCCPECGEPLDVVQKAEAPILMCYNSECTGIVNARLLYEVRVLDLKGFGDSTIQSLQRVASQKIKSYIDLMSMPYDSLEPLLGRNCYKLKQEVDSLKAKGLTVAQFIAMLHIPFIAEHTAKLLCKTYPTLKAMLDSSLVTLTDLLGPIKGDYAFRGLHKVGVRSYYIPAVKGLFSKVTNPDFPVKEEKVDPTSLPLAGRKFHITGKFPVSRKVVEQKIQSLGGVVAATLTSDSTLVVGENPTARKLTGGHPKMTWETLTVWHPHL